MAAAAAGKLARGYSILDYTGGRWVAPGEAGGTYFTAADRDVLTPGAGDGDAAGFAGVGATWQAVFVEIPAQ